MYLSQSIGNIAQKFNNQNTNIIYELSNNLFDLHIGLCDQHTYCVDDKLKISDENINLCCIQPNQTDLINFSCALSNNVLGYASNMKYVPLHINVGIFIHNKKPIQIKKEDLLLIENNLNKTKKVFFSKAIADSWRFKDVDIVRYGINRSHFYETNSVDDRSNKILLIAHNDQNLNIIKQILLSNKIEFDMFDMSSINITKTRDTLNKYKICVDFSENIINLITAISCGCIGIAHNANNLQDSFNGIPNLYFGDSISDIIQTISNVQKNYHRLNITDYFESNFNFDTFATNITKIINYLNRETFYI